MRKIILIAVMISLAVVFYAGSDAGSALTVVDVNPGQDIDSKVNAAAAGSLIQVHCASGGATATYTADRVMTLKSGSQLVGDAGSTTQFVNANVPHPCVTIKGASGAGMTTMFKYSGNSQTRIAWITADAANTQKFVNGSTGGQGNSIDHIVCKNAPASCVGQYIGYLGDSELVNNGTNPTAFDGTVAGIKCIQACEVSHVYAHNNPGNGIWCDVGCISDLVNRPNGFYVHDSVASDNQRHGIFYENSPRPCYGTNDPCNPGDTVAALITNNDVFGNTKSEISVSDSQNGEVSLNTLGKDLSTGTVDASPSNDGVEIHSSGDPSRGQEWNADIHNNDLFGGEGIDGTGTDQDGSSQDGCGDNANTCTANTFN